MAFRFENLEIWQLAIKYASKVFDVADTLPNKTQFNLGSQFRSSVLSISNNIAEGSGSDSIAEFKSFLNWAIRSVSVFETVSALFVAKNKGYITEEEFQELYQEGEILSKKIRAFKKTLK